MINYFSKNVRWLGVGTALALLAPLTVSAAETEGANAAPIAVEQQATTRVSGTVVEDGTGEPIVGAAVMVKGTTIGTVTDPQGNFTLNVPGGNNGVSIEVNFLGFEKAEVFTRGDENLNITLKSDDELISEVVVVGAGTQKKVSVTGSISSIKGDILHAPNSSLTSNLAGKLAGVMSRVSSGEPGAASEFYIRGVSTFGGRATPLILMDGIEISAGDLNRIPAESIESFSILKDASATAIYGARGANGVMIVTTKTGEENQKAKINVRLEASLQTPQNMVEYVDGARFMELYNEAALARGTREKYTKDQIERTRSGKYPEIYPSVDWQDMMFKKHSWSERGNINISGGGSKVTYYMALQLNHETGMLDVPDDHPFDNNINNWEYDFRNNLTYSVTPITKVTMRLNAQFGKKIGPKKSTADLFQRAFKMNPVIFPATYRSFEGDELVRFGNASAPGKDGNRYHNPYAEMLQEYREENYSTVNASVELDQKLDILTKGLSVKVLANLKSWSTMSFERWINPYYYQLTTEGEEGRSAMWDKLEAGGTFDAEDLKLVNDQYGDDFVSEGNEGRGSDRTYYIDGRINYDRTFDDVHNVGAMFMYMQREFRNGIRPNRNQGFSGRVTYDYDHRYLAEFNCGYNGTERMASGDRFEFFPAVSVGWVPSGEEFWKPVEDYIDFFKIRASYGLVGSDETGEGAGAPHFLYANEVKLNDYDGFQVGENQRELKGPRFVSYPVEDAHWERVKKFDVGVDVHFFHQLNIAFDYFFEKRDRILMKRATFPRILGYKDAVPWSNIGEVENKGFDISASWTKQITDDLILDARFNMTYNNNKNKYVDEPDYPYVWQTATDKPLSRTTGYIAEGLFQSQEEIDNSPKQNFSLVRPGDIKYRDVNGDGIINQEDRVMISPYGGLPRMQFGFGFNVTWRKWDAGVFFNASAKRTLMINNLKPFCEADDWDGTDKNVIKFIDKNHWSEENPDPNAEYPRLGLISGDINNNHQESTFWKRNGNFVRFKTAEVGYSFKYGRVYVNADNIAVFAKFKEWDPELNWDSYPLNRTINLGVQFSF